MNWEELGFKHVEKTWGSEDWLVNEESYCAKILIVNQHCGGSYHYHKNKDETFLCISGAAQLLLGQNGNSAEFHELKPGGSVRIHHHAAHLLIGASEEPCVLMEISTHHSDDDVVRHFRIDGLANAQE